MILGMVAANAGVALVPAAARKFRRGAVIYRMLEPAPDNIETAIAWRRDDKSPMLAEFMGAARQTLSRRAH
jgi:DNA-binding transcriptional LysR family regulator